MQIGEGKMHFKSFLLVLKRLAYLLFAGTPTGAFYDAIHTPKNSQMKMYAGMMAASVKGIPMRKKSLFLTSYPSFRRIPMPVILADAPMGVQLPPRVAPERSPKYSAVGSTPICCARTAITGSLVAT